MELSISHSTHTDLLMRVGVVESFPNRAEKHPTVIYDESLDGD